MRQLQYFVSIVEAGSFSAAAAALNLAQPSLSRQIALLESDLGQRLLVRTGRGVTCTTAGHMLLSRARTLLEIARRTREELHELDASPMGRVVIGMPPRLAVALGAPLVQQFRSRLPRAVITVSEGLSVHLREWLSAGRLDLALLFDPPASNQLSYETLLREHLVLVAPARVQVPARVSAASLSAYPMVLPSAPNAIRELVDATLRPLGHSLQVVAEVGAVQTVLALVAQGVGCSILPQSALLLGDSRMRFNCAKIGPPAIRNRLVLARANAGPAGRVVREAAAVLKGLDFARLASVGAEGR